MERTVKSELQGRKPYEVNELILDNVRSSSIEGVTDEFKNLEFLSFINCGLTSLKNFPKLPNLLKLDLSENKISDGFEILVENAPELTKLRLANNPINDLSAIKSFKNFKFLKSIDFYNCGIAKIEDYRNEIFSLIPSIIYLDRIDKFENEEPESDIENDDDFDEEDDDDDLSDDDGDDDDEDDSEDDNLSETDYYMAHGDDDDDLDDTTETATGDDAKKRALTNGDKRNQSSSEVEEEEEDPDESNDDVVREDNNSNNPKNISKGIKRKSENNDDEDDDDD